MHKPEVRIINSQSIEDTPIDFNQYEADALLAKYGYKKSFTNQITAEPSDTRTFNDMVMQQESEIKRLQEDRNRPRAVTFDDSRTSFSETRWSSIEDDGNQYGMQITVVTDMKI